MRSFNLDQDHRVIYASRSAELKMLEVISTDPLIAGAETAPNGKTYDFGMEVSSERQRYMGVAATTKNGWQVYLRLPLSQINQQIVGDYSVGVVMLLLACLLASLLAGGQGRRFAQSINDVHQAVANFTADGWGEEIEIPQNTPSEFEPIFGSMQRRSAYLRRASHRLNNSIEAGEKLRRE